MKMCRREARKAEKRAAILEIAHQSFFENGYAATSMSEIAAKLGGSKATLWSYFPSKEDLFSAVLEDATVQFRQELCELLHLNDDVRTTLTRLCRHFVQKLTEPRSIRLHRLIHGEGERFPEVGRIFYERGPRNVKAMLSAYLDECIERGDLRPTDTMRAAGNLLALTMAGSHQKLMTNMISAATPDDIRADADDAVDIFLRAYAAAGEAA